MPAARHPLAYFDGSPDSKRALQAAAELAFADSGHLTVLLAASDRKRAEALSGDAKSILMGKNLSLEYRWTDPANPVTLLNILRQTPSAVLVLGGREPFKQLPSLESILRDSGVPVLLVREGPEDEED